MEPEDGTVKRQSSYLSLYMFVAHRKIENQFLLLNCWFQFKSFACTQHYLKTDDFWEIQHTKLEHLC